MPFVNLLLALVLCALLLAAPCAAAQDKPFFPLMAWDYVDDADTLKKMADCGINSIAFVPEKMLDACQKAGVKAILYDPALAGSRWDEALDADRAVKALPAIVKRVNNHPALWGYHLKDEPIAAHFPALGRASEAVRKLAPGKWPYVNLFPGDGPEYDKYLDDYITTVKPPILSYDRYVVTEDGSFHPVFWSNIAQVREAALKHRIPFHNIILTAAHWHYRVISDEDLRMQVWGSLVYGAKGIAYYKFMSESLDCLEAPDLGNFRGGPLDEFRRKTPVWDSMYIVNRMVTNLAPDLLKLRSDAVYHFGDIPARNTGPSETSLVKGFKLGDGFVVGDFTHQDGSRWVMVVNKVQKRSIMCLPDYRKEVKSVQYVDPITGKLRKFEPYYAIAPGQGVLLKLEF